MKKIFFILFFVLVFTSCKKDNMGLVEYIVYCERVPFGIEYVDKAGTEINAISYEKDWSIGFIYNESVWDDYESLHMYVFDVPGGVSASSSNVCRLQIKHKSQVVVENTTLISGSGDFFESVSWFFD